MAELKAFTLSGITLEQGLEAFVWPFGPTLVPFRAEGILKNNFLTISEKIQCRSLDRVNFEFLVLISEREIWILSQEVVWLRDIMFRPVALESLKWAGARQAVPAAGVLSQKVNNNIEKWTLHKKTPETWQEFSNEIFVTSKKP